MGRKKIESGYFTTVGCMDGKSNGPAEKLGRERFGQQYADNVTRAGLVGRIGDTGELPHGVAHQLDISFEHHHSVGAVVHSHYPDCAGHPVSRDIHERHTQQTAAIIEKRYGRTAYPVLVNTHSGQVDPLARLIPVESSEL